MTPHPVVHVRLGERDALGVGHGRHLLHGADHGVPGPAGAVEEAVVALEHHGRLVAAGVAQQLAPLVDPDVGGQLVGEADGVEKGGEAAEGGVVHAGGDPQGQLPGGTVGDGVPLLFGGHLLATHQTTFSGP